MSQYKFKINGKDFDVTVNSVEGKNASVTVNGVDYNVELESGLDGAVRSNSGAPENLPIFGDKPRVAAAAEESSRPAQGSAVPAAASGAGKKIVSPLPGVIIDVCVKEGDTVKRGQKIAVIEAMKMETNILTPVAGTVGQINIKEGQQVDAGELIAIIE